MSNRPLANSQAQSSLSHSDAISELRSRKHHKIKRDSAKTQCAATTMRRALLYALICHKARAQDNYASLRRAARQSYGFGDARYASHPRHAAAGGEDAPRRRRRRRPVQVGDPNVCESRSRAGVRRRAPKGASAR